MSTGVHEYLVHKNMRVGGGKESNLDSHETTKERGCIKHEGTYSKIFR
jgi:hypothetical protein